MGRKPALVLRILAILTAIEALAGFCLVALGVLGLRTDKRLFGPQFAYFDLTLFATLTANCIFLILLTAAGLYLWRLQRRGLFLLALTLVTEILYLIGFVTALAHFYPRVGNATSGLGKALGAVTGFGNMALTFQLYTVYPLIAAVLIFLGYRYLGIPARDSS